MQLRYDSVEEIVDNAVNLIRKIQAATLRIDLPWLMSRGEDGFFPTSTFD